MIPRGSEGISHVADRVASDLIPKAVNAYVATDLGCIAALISMIGQDYDRAAHVLTREHEATVEILRAAQPHLDDAGLTRRIGEALALAPSSLRTPDLHRRADLMLKLLIDLHEAIEAAEAQGQVWAGRLNKTVWAFLDAFAAHRIYDVAF